MSARNFRRMVLTAGVSAFGICAHAQDTPPLPEGKTLDEVLEYSANPPPAHFPAPVMDDHAYVFTLIEQLEYRVAEGSGTDHLGWEAQGWVGGDFQKFWWKSEGEAVFQGADEGESEFDFLYSRLFTPFWNFQAGIQYANAWGESYEDRWSAVVAVQGLAPYKFEFDSSLYLSENGDLTLETEAEYDIRVTQRLVLQPRGSLGASAHDIPERGIGAGFTDLKLDLRLRYEVRRELAPYLVVRYATSLGQTRDIVEAIGGDTNHWYFGGGARFAF